MPPGACGLSGGGLGPVVFRRPIRSSFRRTRVVLCSRKSGGRAMLSTLRKNMEGQLRGTAAVQGLHSWRRKGRRLFTRPSQQALWATRSTELRRMVSRIVRYEKSVAI